MRDHFLDFCRSIRWLPLLLSACASTGKGAHETEEAVAASALLAPMSGRYVIRRDGEDVGEERFTITSSAGRWVARGEIVMSWRGEERQSYQLAIDQETRAPISFEIWYEILGERQAAHGVCDGDLVRVRTEGILGEAESEVAHGPGTVIDFGSPIFDTVALTRLLPLMKEQRPIPVRAVVIAMPLLSPAVVVYEYTLAGRDGDLLKISAGPPQRAEGQRPTALWVRSDGLPVRVRTWPEGGGVPIELTLEEPGSF